MLARIDNDCSRWEGAPTRSSSKLGRRVAVLGGGMAGLAAAHELIERGFEVHVYERHELGGKARSIGVAGTARGGRRPLPGEHGFRFRLAAGQSARQLDAPAVAQPYVHD